MRWEWWWWRRKGGALVLLAASARQAGLPRLTREFRQRPVPPRGRAAARIVAFAARRTQPLILDLIASARRLRARAACVARSPWLAQLVGSARRCGVGGIHGEIQDSYVPPSCRSSFASTLGAGAGKTSLGDGVAAGRADPSPPGLPECRLRSVRALAHLPLTPPAAAGPLATTPNGDFPPLCLRADVRRSGETRATCTPCKSAASRHDVS